MISRLVLNLRSGKDNSMAAESAHGMKFMTRTIGNLGDDMETFLDPPSLNSTAGRTSGTYVEDIPMTNMPHDITKTAQ